MCLCVRSLTSSLLLIIITQLMPPTKQDFEEKGYYTWLYEGPQALSNFMTFLIIAGFLAITCFPIWPHFLKVRCQVTCV